MKINVCVVTNAQNKLLNRHSLLFNRLHCIYACFKIHVN